MRSALAAAASRRATRSRSASLSTVPPSESSNDYVPELAAIAASILYRSPLASREGRPIFILNAAAFPDAWEVDYDSLLSYVLARLPGEEELISGTEYEVVFFAGGQPEGATSEKKQGPGIGWYLQAYHVLSRATRKKLQRLYIVHPRTWVRVLIGVFGTIVSPKFRRKIAHVSTLSQLALQVPIERLLIPPSTYLQDRKLAAEIDVPYASGRRAFGARHPLPKNIDTGQTRLPRVLRETTSFLLLPQNITVEGLFRIPPHNVLAGVLQEAYNRGQQFIVWKEKNATVVQPGISQTLLDEIRLEDAYGVHLAASMIKRWYHELLLPIFPESSYAGLREKYSSPDAKITLEELVELILPASPISPLTSTSREVLTRHLFPLLSAVAEHEAQNKMNAENLAILFSMCLVCGSNQLEDARMANVIKKILQAAIVEWPQLRDGLGISTDAFATNLLPPVDSRDYEDAVEDERYVSGAHEQEDGHRIIMADLADDIEEKKRQPLLPPRISEKVSGMVDTLKDRLPLTTPANVGAPTESKRTPPTVPPRLPPRSRAASVTKPTPSPTLDVNSVALKRKPTPAQASDSGLGVTGPTKYSPVIDGNGRNTTVAESPVTYTSGIRLGPLNANGFPDEKTAGLPLHQQPDNIHPSLNMPKRKAISGTDSDPSSKPTHAGSNVRSVSESSTQLGLAKLVAQNGADISAQRDGADDVEEDNPAVRMTAALLASDSDAIVFRKPSWPASATRHPQFSSTTTAVPSSSSPPILPIRASRTFHIPPDNHGLNPPTSGPRARAPSPGLLKRMESMETSNAQPALKPRRLNMKKASVDDLRRLYEDRVSFAEGLRKVDEARRGSGQTL
ncbi:hypothetical protein LTR62_005607 [Meristemomyces frigidus]|uniref:CRAL-TRIO domain-containing protein n=1 Tax=Meristemomyces frigidus TaxID=1508187 RepID=A0AAN7TDC4_9PEZI|nr:hypothetical protein LTR62_005607 [Meristemomyces frigidus]